MNALPNPDNARPLTIAQLVVSLVGLITLSLAFIGFFVVIFFFPEAGLSSNEFVRPILNMLWVVLALILLTIPSLVSSIRRLNGAPARVTSSKGFLFASVSLVLSALLVYFWVSYAPANLVESVGGLINVLVVSVPLWWFFELGRLGLARISAQRQWGASTFGVFVTMPLVILAEIIVLGIGLIFAAIWLTQQPEFVPYLQQIESGMPFGLLNPQEMDIDWLSLLQNPFVITAIFLSFSVIMPLIEELLKPLGVWVLMKRGLTPSSGFIVGMVCGATFAFLESSFALSTISGDDWLFTVVGRVGANLLHLALTGFNGWALFATWIDGKYLRVGVTYLITTLIHGAWNFLALLMGLNTIGEEQSLNINPALTSGAQWALVALSAALLGALLLLNAHLRKSPAPAITPPPLRTPDGSLRLDDEDHSIF